MLKGWRSSHHSHHATLRENERLIYEGVFISLSTSSGEILLGMVEELVQNTDSLSERTINTYFERALFDLNNVA